MSKRLNVMSKRLKHPSDNRQGDLLGFVTSWHEKEADHRDTTIYFTDYGDMKFKLTAHRLDSENRNTVL